MQGVLSRSQEIWGFSNHKESQSHYFQVQRSFPEIISEAKFLTVAHFPSLPFKGSQVFFFKLNCFSSALGTFELQDPA